MFVGVNYAPEKTGIAPYTAGMAEKFAAGGARVRVLTTFPHYPEWRFAEGDEASSSRNELNGVDVIRLRHRLPRAGSAVSRVVSEVSFGLRAALAHWDDPDVVVVVSPALFASAVVSLRARLRRRRKLVTWVQDLYGPGVRETGAGDRFGLAERLVASVERALLRSSDGVAVIHERLVNELSEMGVDPQKVSVVRNWSHVRLVSLVGRAQMRERLGWKSNEIVVLHTGNMGVKQDLGTIIEAARLAAVTDPAIRFVLMGDGNTRMELQAQSVGVERMSIVDPLPASSYLDALRSADVLLVNEHPALRVTALPSKLTSYFTSGRPVLAATSADSLAADEVARSRSGLRVEPGEPSALLGAVRALVDDPLQARRYAENGRRYVSERLTLESSAQALGEMLERVAGRAKRRGNARATRDADRAGAVRRAG